MEDTYKYTYIYIPFLYLQTYLFLISFPLQRDIIQRIERIYIFPFLSIQKDNIERIYTYIYIQREKCIHTLVVKMCAIATTLAPLVIAEARDNLYYSHDVSTNLILKYFTGFYFPDVYIFGELLRATLFQLYKSETISMTMNKIIIE